MRWVRARFRSCRRSLAVFCRVFASALGASEVQILPQIVLEETLSLLVFVKTKIYIYIYIYIYRREPGML